MRLHQNPVIKYLDYMWRVIIAFRADHRCELCRKAGSDCAHIITRRNQWTRWHEKNGLVVCVDCHDDQKIEAWLKANDPARYRWIVRQRAKVHYGRFDLVKIQKKLECKAYGLA